MTHIEDRFARDQEIIDRQCDRFYISSKEKLEIEVKRKLKEFIEKRDLSRTRSEEKRAIEKGKEIMSHEIKKTNTIENEFKNNLNKKKQEENNFLMMIRNLNEQINRSMFKDFLNNIEIDSDKGKIEKKFNSLLEEEDIEINPSEEKKTIELAVKILENKAIKEEEIRLKYASFYQDLENKKQNELEKTNKVLNEIKEDKFELFFIELMN
jgi:hypothetical protein